MNRKEKINDILDLSGVNYVRGVTEVIADYQVVKELQDAELLNMEQSYSDGPTMSQFVDFMGKYHQRSVELKLIVADPERNDFSINVKAISIPVDQAKINNDSDLKFWMDWVNLSKIGSVSMVEDDIQVSWEWCK